MLINSSNIDDYLKRFFDGETTRAEEEELSRYFREEKSLSRENERYREMFAWIDAGMPEERVEKPKRRVLVFKRAAVWWSSVAAIALLALICVTLVMNRKGEAAHFSQSDSYSGSYVENKGMKITDVSSIIYEIKSTLKDVDDMEREIADLNFDFPDLVL